MSGICGYLPIETLSNYCAKGGSTGAQVAIGLTLLIVAVTAVYNKVKQAQDTPPQANPAAADRNVDEGARSEVPSAVTKKSGEIARPSASNERVYIRQLGDATNGVSVRINGKTFNQIRAEVANQLGMGRDRVGLFWNGRFLDLADHGNELFPIRENIQGLRFVIITDAGGMAEV